MDIFDRIGLRAARERSPIYGYAIRGYFNSKKEMVGVLPQ
jgi:hypothetical protein